MKLLKFGLSFVLIVFLSGGEKPVFSQTDFWQSANGPYGGSVQSLVVSPSGDVFAGTGRGIFRSADRCNTWSPSIVGIGVDEIWSLAVNASGHIFAGTEYDGIFRSVNNGISWTAINNGFSAFLVLAIAINPVNGHVFASSIDGAIFRSTNNGDSWMPIGAGITTRDVLALAINANGHVFAGTFNGGAFRSIDNGDTWKPINEGLTNDDIRTFVFNSNGDVFAGTWGSGVFRSTNNGDNWAKIKNGFSASSVWKLAINASGHIFAATTGSYSGIYRSMNNGDNWTKVNNGLELDDIRSVAIDLGGDLFAGTEGAGIFRSLNNGDEWSMCNHGLTAHTIDALLVTLNYTIFAGTTSGLFRSSDSAKTWTRVPNTLTYRGVSELAINSAGHLFAASGSPYRSTDNGNTWMQIKSGMTTSSVTSFAFYPDQIVFAGTLFNGVYRSTNNGDTWTAVNNGLASLMVRAVLVNAKGDIFAGTEDGVFRSSDFGDNWMPVNNGLPDFLISIQTLAINAQGHIFAGDGFDGVYRSTNNGDSWIATGLKKINIISLTINTLGHLFASNNTDGVYRSNDQGNTWRTLSSGLTQSDVRSLVHSPNQILFAGTYNHGIFRSVYPTTILSPPAAPQLALPPNGSSNRATTLNLTWNAVPEADSYRLQVATDLSFASLVFDESGITSTSRQIGTLANYTTYFWRVSALNAGGTSEWSSIWSFTTIIGAPAPPTLISPPDYATNQPTVLILNWNEQTSVTAYHLQVSKNRSFAATIVNDSTINASQFIVSPLANNTTYYWQVKAKNAGGSSAWSNVWSFTTIIAAPTAPTLISPANGAANQSTILTLSWNPAAGSENYRLQVSTNSAFTTTVFEDSMITATSRQVGPLANNTTYYWQVKAKNAGGSSAWSNVWSFRTIIAAPTAPALISPANGAVNQSTILTLSWNPAAGAENYRLQVSTNSAFTTTVFEDSMITATSRQIGPLTNNTTYYWQVKAKNAGGSSAWSNVWSFTTIIQLPSQVLLISPMNAAVIEIDSAQFIWRPSAPAISRYWFELATDSAMTNTVIDSALLAADTTKTVRQLFNKQTYWWKVRAGNVAGWGPFSEQRKFHVDIFTNVHAADDIPKEFSLSQNYPNPFNSSTTIEFALPKAEFVTLKVYNIRGEEMATLMEGNLPSGRHQSEWNANGFANGVYFYTLQTASFFESKKLIIIK